MGVVGGVFSGVGFVVGHVFPCLASKPDDPPGAWFCKTCGARNNGGVAACASCGSGSTTQQKLATSSASAASPPSQSRRAERNSLRDRRRVSLRRDSEEDTMTF